MDGALAEELCFRCFLRGRIPYTMHVSQEVLPEARARHPLRQYFALMDAGVPIKAPVVVLPWADQIGR